MLNFRMIYCNKCEEFTLHTDNMHTNSFNKEELNKPLLFGCDNCKSEEAKKYMKELEDKNREEKYKKQQLELKKFIE